MMDSKPCGRGCGTSGRWSPWASSIVPLSDKKPQAGYALRWLRRARVNIRLNKNGWDETQPLNGVSCKRRRGRSMIYNAKTADFEAPSIRRVAVSPA